MSCGDARQNDSQSSSENEGSFVQTAAREAAKSRHEKHGTESKRKSPFGQDPDDYILTFAEEFDRLDPGIWNDHIWYEPSHPMKNYTVENGMLKIWPERDASGKFFNRTFDTDGKFHQTYGYFEMEAKLPHGK